MKIFHSGLTLTRLGRAANWIFFNSVAVTLHDSRVRDRRFFSGFKWCKPELETREFDMFSETSDVSPTDKYQIDIYQSNGFSNNIPQLDTI